MSVIEYGLIGHPLRHSLSPALHNDLMQAAGINGIYRLYDLPEDEFSEQIEKVMAELAGFNCTIPYKERILPHLTALDHTAESIRAVNTVHAQKGYNTDFAAFQKSCPLDREQPVLVLGAGGVSRTMAYAAVKQGCAVWIVARRYQQAEELALFLQKNLPGARVTALADLDSWRSLAGGQQAKKWLLLNGTPVGLWPRMDQMPVAADDLAFCDRVFDTIYNPVASKLVLAARSRGIAAQSGLDMLFNQAVLAQQIWHPQACFSVADLELVRQRLVGALLEQSPLTLILTGFMGSGKTTVGRLLAQILNWPFLDLDQVIEEKSGLSIEELFATRGEAGFRQLEQENLALLLAQKKNLVLGTGGGALIQPLAGSIRQKSSSFVIFLDATFPEIQQRLGDGQGRPLIAGRSSSDWQRLFSERSPQYNSIADLTIQSRGNPCEVAKTIVRMTGLEASI